MAIQVINDPSWGSQVGVNLGQQLSKSLQDIASTKVKQLATRHGLQGLGIPKEQAEQISYLPPELQKSVVSNYLAGAENAGLSQALGSLGRQPQEGLGTMQAQQLPAQQAQTGQTQGKSFADILKNPRLKPEHRLKVAALQQQKELAQQRISAAQQRDIDKETLPVYKETTKAAKAAHDTTKTLDRMDNLIKTGKLSAPLFHSLLKTAGHGLFGTGIDLHFLESPESAEFTKLSNSFIKNAKNVFGSRITDNDLKAFMNTVPNLLQNDEGKQRIIHNMRVENKAAEIRAQAMKEIIKENSGRRPADLESQIEEKAGPQLDALAQEFAAGFQPQEEGELAMLKDFVTQGKLPTYRD